MTITRFTSETRREEVIRYAFDNPVDFVDHCRLADPVSEICPREHLQKEHFIGRSFSSLDHCCDSSLAVWDEGVELIENMITQLQDFDVAGPKTKKRVLHWSDFRGSEFCTDRLYSGQDFLRRSTREITTGSNYVPILCDMATPGSYSPDTVMWRGAAMVALADRLEQEGYRCELFATSLTNCYGDHAAWQFTSVKLKAYDEPLDVASLASFVSGWCYRTLWFYCRDNVPEGLRDGIPRAAYHAGTPTSLTSTSGPLTMGDLLEAWPDWERAIYLRDCFSEYDAKQLLDSLSVQFG